MINNISMCSGNIMDDVVYCEWVLVHITVLPVHNRNDSWNSGNRIGVT